MKTLALDQLVLECVRGDIARQPDVEAIVNAANAHLLPGAGVAGAIHRAAGPGLVQECRSLAPIKPGEAVITGAHSLPNRYVIHCLGPVYGFDEPSDQLLASCYRRALRLAEDHRVTSLAFPAISTGVFGYPIERAVHVALGTVISESASLSTVRRVRFVLFSREDLEIYETALGEFARPRGAR